MIASEIKACLFDVFGTVVDWRSSVRRDLEDFARAKGIRGIDWLEFAVEWRKLYQPAMDEVRSGRRAFTILDVLHRESLVKLIQRYGIAGLSEDDVDHMSRAWHRLDPWPDVREGLTRLKRARIIAPCSNGNIALMVNLAKRAGLPWDLNLSCELYRAYKPQPASYLGAVGLLGIRPDEAMMVAAHYSDLQAAATCGLRTAYVHRPREFGDRPKRDLPDDPAVDLVVGDFEELATRLGA